MIGGKGFTGARDVRPQAGTHAELLLPGARVADEDDQIVDADLPQPVGATRPRQDGGTRTDLAPLAIQGRLQASADASRAKPSGTSERETPLTAWLVAAPIRDDASYWYNRNMANIVKKEG